MIWVDILAIVVIVGIAFLEKKRGFGLSLFDLVGAVIIIKLSVALAPLLASSAPLGYTPIHAQGIWLAILFTVLAVLVLIASKLIYQSCLLSLDVMDPVVGAILGIGVGLILAHVIMRVMVLVSDGTPFGDILVQTAAVKQLVELQGFSYVLNSMRHVGDLPPQ